jgi:hypothetical protein
VKLYVEDTAVPVTDFWEVTARAVPAATPINTANDAAIAAMRKWYFFI